MQYFKMHINVDSGSPDALRSRFHINADSCISNVFAEAELSPRKPFCRETGLKSCKSEGEKKKNSSKFTQKRFAALCDATRDKACSWEGSM